MLNLTRTIQKKLLRLLVPLLQTEASREALLYEALGINDRSRRLIATLRTDGSPHDVTISLITQLIEYGTISDAEHGEVEALWAVMLAARERVGVDKQRVIDELEAELNPVKAPVLDHITVPSNVAEGAHVFISYARDDIAIVNRLTADLQESGLPLWVDTIGLKAGTPDWEQAIRQAIHEARCVLLAASPRSQRSQFVRDELAIADMYEKPVYPLWIKGTHWIDCIPMGRGYSQYINLRGPAYSTNFADVLETVGEIDNSSSRSDTDEVQPSDFQPRNPYKGLRSFKQADRRDFFGRESLIIKLIDALRDRRFLAVIGPSGSGKSSVIMAGLIPALQQDGQLSGSENWVYLPPMVPGARPLDNLRKSLARVLPHKGQTAIRDDLVHESTEGLAMLADEAAGYDPERRVVLYIDQFEEFFTLTNTDSERNQFVNLLTTALLDPDNALTVILTLRADFYYLFSAYADLAAFAETHSVIVPPMSIGDLYTIIERPASAENVRLTFESGLIEEIVFAFREEYAVSAGSLPLLQFTLERLFEARDDLQLTWEAYEAIGGVHGAIGTHAESVYLSLDEATQAAFSRVFIRLISVDERGTPTRQRAELEPVTRVEDMANLVQAFTDNRLLVTGTADDDTRYVEVAHEALLTNWERLVSWTEDITDQLRLIREVERAAATWDAMGRPDYLLWSHEHMMPVYTAQADLAYEFTGAANDFVRPEAEILLERFKAEVEEDADQFKLIALIDRMAEIGEPARDDLLRAWQIAITTT